MTYESDRQNIQILYSLCRERMVAYKEASKHVQNQGLKSLFKKYSEQSSSFMQDYCSLRGEVSEEAYKATPELGGFKVNDDVRLNIEGGSEEDILQACKMGDLSVLKVLDDILNKPMSKETTELVCHHLIAITAAYDNVCGILKQYFKS